MRGDCPERASGCPYFETGCYADTHHTAWPSTDYTTALERIYRDLPDNKLQLCRFQHDLEHQLDPPTKPSREVMQHAVDTAVQIGQVSLSATKQRRIYGKHRGD